MQCDRQTKQKPRKNTFPDSLYNLCLCEGKLSFIKNALQNSHMYADLIQSGSR